MFQDIFPTVITPRRSQRDTFQFRMTRLLDPHSITQPLIRDPVLYDTTPIPGKFGPFL